MARIFDTLAQPVAGNDDWYLRDLEQRPDPDNEDRPVWHVLLMRRSDGHSIGYRNGDLYVAWARAVEAARSEVLGLNDAPATEGGTSRYSSEMTGE